LLLGISYGLNFKGIKTINEFLHFAHKKEVSAVELVAEPPYCIIDLISSVERKRIRKLASDLGLELSVHATFSDVNIAAYNDKIRLFSLSIMKDCIDFSQDIGSKIVTIHPGELNAGGHTFPEDVVNNSFNSFKELALYADEKDVIIGYENMPIFPWTQYKECFAPEPLSQVVNEINSKSLGITWDIGHSNTTEYPQTDFLKHFKSKLVHIHIHDNAGHISGWKDTHTVIGKGTIQWKSLLSEIKKINYEGIYVMELQDEAQIDESIEFLSQI
jgi:sugar phosphate isomerase/epimerase